MKPRFEDMPTRIFAGKHITMSFADNKTGELWRTFMPLRKQVANTIGTELYSIEVYPTGFFEQVYTAATFEKWAAVELSETGNLSEDLEVLTAPAGLYAVFVHYGPAVNGPETYRYIFAE